MNEDIKKGATQMVAGIKAEAKDFTSDAKEKFEKIKDIFDKNDDGKVDFKEVTDGVTGEAKKSFDKISSLLKDDKVSEKTKAELKEAMDSFKSKVQPVIDKAKQEIEEKKYTLEAGKDKAEEKVEALGDKVEDKVEELKPALEAKKMEAEILKEKVEAEVEHAQEIKEMKKEILD